MDNDITFWTFTLPNYVLAALTYTLLGRIVLSFLFASRPDAVINRVFAQITDPVLRVVRFITPLAVGNGLIIVLAVVWLLALRMFLFLVTRALGFAPTDIV